jgi:hypothetical protein
MAIQWLDEGEKARFRVRRLLTLSSTLLLVVACSGGAGRTGGAIYTGEFDIEPGIGPGSIVLELDDTGNAIPRLSIDPGLEQFTCPAGQNAGVRITGGGYTVTVTPGIQISGDSFDHDGLVGSFTSPTEVGGTFDLSTDYDCAHVITWSATAD